MILNPKFRSFKSTGFESIIEFFRESCCNHLKCVSYLAFLILFTSHTVVLRPTVSNDATSTMSSRPEPFMGWPIHTNAACSMWRPPMKQKYPSNSPYPALIIVNFYCLNITLLANLNKTNFNKLIEMIIFFRFFSMWFHVIQAIEVNIIHLLLDVSETSIIALAGIPAGRIWPTHIYFFHKHQCSFVHTLSICFIHFSIFYNLIFSAIWLLLLLCYWFL